MIPFLPVLIFLAGLSTSSGQLIDEGYVHPTFAVPKSKIEQYTHEAFQSLLSSFAKDGDGGGWTAQNAWTTVAQNDLIHGSRDFYDAVKAAQDRLSQNAGHGAEYWGNQPLINVFNDDIGWAGLSNIVAHEAYGNPEFLERAKGAYEFVKGHGYIDQAVINRGYLEGTKNPDNKISGSCNGKSMVGGVYWVNGNNPAGSSPDARNHDGVNAVSTGNFALLGAELCRITKDTSYCDRSFENVWWLDRHMVTDNGYLYDGISGKECKITDWRFTYNQGLYFATYAALGSLTQNSTATDIAREAIKKAILPSAPWNSPNGVIKEGQGDASKTDDGIGFKSIMIRYMLNSMPLIGDAELTKAVMEYINIQYYAITQLNSDNKEHPVRFGRNWQGPYAPSTNQAQLAAMDVLNAITMNPDSAYPSNGSGPVVKLGERDESADSEAVVAPPATLIDGPSSTIIEAAESLPPATLADTPSPTTITAVKSPPPTTSSDSSSPTTVAANLAADQPARWPKDSQRGRPNRPGAASSQQCAKKRSRT